MPAKAKARRNRTFRHPIQFDPWLESKINEYLANNTADRGALTRSALVRKCVVRFFKEEESYWPLVFLRLDKLTGAIRALDKRFHLLTNLEMHRLAYEFLNWPDLSPEEKTECAHKSQAMLVKFTDSLTRKLQSGAGYLSDLNLEDIQDVVTSSLENITLELGSPDEPRSDKITTPSAHSKPRAKS